MYTYDITDSLDRSELLAAGDAVSASRKVLTGIQAEVRDTVRACRSNPDWLDNWVSLIEVLTNAKSATTK